jgi:hypothetical protein
MITEEYYYVNMIIAKRTKIYIVWPSYVQSKYCWYGTGGGSTIPAAVVVVVIIIISTCWYQRAVVVPVLVPLAGMKKDTCFVLFWFTLTDDSEQSFINNIEIDFTKEIT